MADEDVLLQADALMRRHRRFVAQGPQSGETNYQPAFAGDAEDGDIPLLTEVVALPEELAPLNIDEVLDELHREIERLIANWLIDALPAAVANASQHILTEVDAKARLTLLPQVQALIDSRRNNGQ